MKWRGVEDCTAPHRACHKPNIHWSPARVPAARRGPFKSQHEPPPRERKLSLATAPGRGRSWQRRASRAGHVTPRSWNASARPAARPPAGACALRRVRERCSTGRGSREYYGLWVPLSKMELSAVGERVFAAESIIKRRIRKVSFRPPPASAPRGRSPRGEAIPLTRLPRPPPSRRLPASPHPPHPHTPPFPFLFFRDASSTW